MDGRGMVRAVGIRSGQKEGDSAVAVAHPSICTQMPPLRKSDLFILLFIGQRLPRRSPYSNCETAMGRGTSGLALRLATVDRSAHDMKSGHGIRRIVENNPRAVERRR